MRSIPLYLAAACVLGLGLNSLPSQADTSLDAINAVMETKGSMHNNRVGALVGARVHCKLEYKPLFNSWDNRYGMNSKTPMVKWEQMIDVAKSTISDLEAGNVSCSEAAKQALMSRVE